MNLDDIEKSIKNSKKLAALLFIGVPLIYFFWFFIIQNHSFSTNSSIWGTFGDFMGGILNPIIALLAFYWLTQSVLIQKTELNETKQALVDSSESQRQQVITQEKKRFEDTFFSLLDQHNKALDKLSEAIVINQKTQYSFLQRMTRSVFMGDTDKIEQARDKLHKDFNPSCGHYFRILYQLLKLIAVNCHASLISQDFKCEEIKSSPVSSEEKFYSNIVRSFISFDMAKLIAVNCACESSNDIYYKYKLLIERYSFLEHMPIDHKVTKDATGKYHERAFGNSVFFAKQRT